MSLFGDKLKSSASVIQWILVAGLIVAAYYIGNLTAKVQLLQKGTTTATTQTAQPQQPTVSLDTIKGIFGKDLIKFGDAKSKVLFVEVADPSCPYCHIAAGKDPELNEASGQFKLVSQGGTYLPPVEEFKKLVDAGTASFAYIYSPGHGNGEMAMKSLYCAFEKGKFWEAHDLLMSEKGYIIQNGVDATNAPATSSAVVKNDKTKSGDIAQFLASAVDPAFMKSCLDSGKYDGRLGTDTELASSLGVRGTPGFFVNATNFAGAYNYTDMKPIVDEALK